MAAPGTTELREGFHNAGRLNTNAVVLRLFLNKLANGDFD